MTFIKLAWDEIVEKEKHPKVGKRVSEEEMDEVMRKEGYHRCPDGVYRVTHPSFDCNVCEYNQGR